MRRGLMKQKKYSFQMSTKEGSDSGINDLLKACSTTKGDMFYSGTKAIGYVAADITSQKSNDSPQ